MTVELMEHQREGVAFLLGRRAGLLAFEQGLGKTLVAIEAFTRASQEGSTQRLLVICPNSLKRNWKAELTKFAPDLDVTIVEGDRKSRRALLASVQTSVIITSYETARAEVTGLLALLGRKPTALVLDESHAAKNRNSLTSTAARHFAPHATHRWLLSGTPVTNSPTDLYTQIEIVNANERPLGSIEVFKNDALDATRAEAARSRLAPFFLRKTKDECLDLPDKIFVDVRVELPPWQRTMYDQMRNDMVCAIDGMTGEEFRAFASTALVQLTRLCQIASNPSLLFPESEELPGKFEELDYLVNEILDEPGRKIIIWSNYVRNIEHLLGRYEAHGAAALYGGTPAADRQATAARFQTDPAARVLIGNPAAAGTGFTLTAATYSIYESLSWRYDYYAQSQDRNHRIGQTLPVTYLRMIAADTIDEAIVTALERKSSMAHTLLGDDKDLSPRISGFSREQMRTLLLNNELPRG
jgi:SNF2 family DNA or RNA helicase